MSFIKTKLENEIALEKKLCPKFLDVKIRSFSSKNFVDRLTEDNDCKLL